MVSAYDLPVSPAKESPTARFRVQATVAGDVGQSDLMVLTRDLVGASVITYGEGGGGIIGFTLAAPDDLDPAQVAANALEIVRGSAAQQPHPRELELTAIAEKLCCACDSPATGVVRVVASRADPGEGGASVTLRWAEGLVPFCERCSAEKPAIGMCERDRMWGRAGSRCWACGVAVPALEPRPPETPTP